MFFQLLCYANTLSTVLKSIGPLTSIHDIIPRLQIFVYIFIITFKNTAHKSILNDSMKKVLNCDRQNQVYYCIVN